MRRTASHRRGIGWPVAPAAVLAGLALAGCAINPATGKRQFVLISEAQEIELGRQSDRDIVAQFGDYEDAALQDRVSELGHRLAAGSERARLDWTFRVLDDPLVNAFALPGGYVYVTRGILAHFNSEAELVSVLGHEIGHVTARHSVSQISKAQLAQLGLGAGAMIVPESMQGLIGLFEAGTGLLFLKFGREDERQADELGLRYLVAAGYDPHAMVEVFEMLGRVSGDPADRAPSWASTHPHPADREERINRAIATLGPDVSNGTIGATAYLDLIDGIVFGQDPRHGFFVGSLFMHPEMRFSLRFPDGWKLQNQRESVIAITEQRDGLIRLSLARQATAEEALQDFIDRNRLTRGAAWNPSPDGLTARGSAFELVRESGSLVGEVVCVEHGGRVYQLVGVTVESRGTAYRPPIRETLASFALVTDRRVLDVKPARLEIVRPDEAITLEELARRYAASVDVETLAAINNVDRGALLEAGRPYKVVRGGELPDVGR